MYCSIFLPDGSSAGPPLRRTSSPPEPLSQTPWITPCNTGLRRSNSSRYILAPHKSSMHTTDSDRQPILPIASVQLGPLSTIDFNVSQEVELLHCATPRENTMRSNLQHVPQPAANTNSDRRTLARDQALPQTVEAREILVALHQGFVLISASPEVHRGEHGQRY